MPDQPDYTPARQEIERKAKEEQAKIREAEQIRIRDIGLAELEKRRNEKQQQPQMKAEE